MALGWELLPTRQGLLLREPKCWQLRPQPGPFMSRLAMRAGTTLFPTSNQELMRSALKQADSRGLLSNSCARVALTVTPGNVSETVMVTAAPPLLQTDRADISTKIDATSVAEL